MKKLALALLMICLSASIGYGVEKSEPPELSGTNKNIEKISDKEKDLSTAIGNALRILGNGKNQEKNKEAIDSINKIIEANPSCAQAYDTRAMIYLYYEKDQDYKKIVADITRAISLPYSNLDREFSRSGASEYSMRAKAYKEMGNYKQAIKDMDKAIDLDPDDAIKPLDETGGWGKSFYDDIIKKYPNDYRGYLFRGLYYRNFYMLLKPQNYKSAIVDFNKAISLNPNSATAYYLKGTLVLNKVTSFGGGGKSKEDLRKEGRALATGQSIWSVYPKERKIILDAFTKAIRLNPKMIDAYKERAEVYLETKEFKMAIKDYDSVIGLDPDNGGTYNDRGLAKMNLGDYNEAVEDFTSAIDAKKPSNVSLSYENRADAYVKLGNYEAAIGDYTKAIALQLKNDTFIMGLEKFRELYPEYNNVSDDELIKNLYDKFYTNWKYEEFADFFRKAHQIPYDIALAELYDKRSGIYWNTGNYKKAVDDYNRVTKINPPYADNMEKWKWFSNDSRGRHYINIKDVTFNKSYITFWAKYVFNRKPKNNIAENIVNIELDCSSKMLKVVSYIDYDSKGNAMNSWNGGDWESIVPDSIGESMYAGWCR